MTLHSFYWLTRLYVCASVMVTVMVALFDPSSQHHQSMLSDGVGGKFAIITLGAVAFVGLFDVIWSDLRKSNRLSIIKRHRYLLFLLMAMGQASLILVNVRYGIIEPLIARYSLDALMATLVAWYSIKILCPAHAPKEV